MEDLAGYSPGWSTPIHTTYRGYDIYSNPSTTRGGFEVLMGLNLVEGWDIGAMDGPNDPRVLHLQAEAIKVSKACIYEHVADPKHKPVPTAVRSPPLLLFFLPVPPAACTEMAPLLSCCLLLPACLRNGMVRPARGNRRACCRRTMPPRAAS